jgi:hypothetical protein
MEIPDPIKKEVLDVMIRNWYGDILLTFQAGRLVLIKKSEVIKPPVPISVPQNEGSHGNTRR